MPCITLKSLKYQERVGQPLEWSLSELRLGNVNLVVGKNATGKTRTLNVIANLAKSTLIDGTIRDGSYDVSFENQGDELRYELVAFDGKVISERVTKNGVERLMREGDKLSIYAAAKGETLEFSPPENVLAAVSRRDKLQHPFLLPLHEWADSVRHYHFGGLLGKDSVALVARQPGGAGDIDDRDENNIIQIITDGQKKFGDAYTLAILADMREIGYELSEVTVEKPEHVSFALQGGKGPVPFPAELRVIGIREAGIDGRFFQDAMSHGMFRALSIIAQVNYSQLAKRANCIIIDDIGEGLDFDRASLLIEVLRKKAQQASFQLIMSTNDQFVMNHVPLDEWSILKRSGQHVDVRNIFNSQQVFEDFRFVGLSNFSFFELDFANASPSNEDGSQP